MNLQSSTNERKLVATMIGVELEQFLRKLSVTQLERPELGTAFNFKQSLPPLGNIHNLLVGVIDADERALSKEEIQKIQRAALRLRELQNSIQNFDPQQREAVVAHQNLTKEISEAWNLIAHDLRPIWSAIRLRELGLDETQKKLSVLLSDIDRIKNRSDDLARSLETLPNNAQQQFDSTFNDLQKRATDIENSLRERATDARSKTELELQGLVENISRQIQRAQKQIADLSTDTEQKVQAVLNDAKKFSAKEALSSYADIFWTEAENVNKPSIRTWTIVLVMLSITEIAAAISLFFFFLPEVIEIAEMYGDSTLSASLIGSAILIKVFILSVIAVGISYAVKNLNAQNHLYATNKFKANSLRSFIAFLQSTDNPEIVDDIVRHVAAAVYTQGISGYLSKDDAAPMKALDVETASGLLSKITGK